MSKITQTLNNFGGEDYRCKRTSHTVLLFSRFLQNQMNYNLLDKIYLFGKFFSQNFCFPNKKVHCLAIKQMENKFQDQVVAFDFSKNLNVVVLLMRVRDQYCLDFYQGNEKTNSFQINNKNIILLDVKFQNKNQENKLILLGINEIYYISFNKSRQNGFHNKIYLSIKELKDQIGENQLNKLNKVEVNNNYTNIDISCGGFYQIKWNIFSKIIEIVRDRDQSSYKDSISHFFNNIKMSNQNQIGVFYDTLCRSDYITIYYFPKNYQQKIDVSLQVLSKNYLFHNLGVNNEIDAVIGGQDDSLIVSRNYLIAFYENDQYQYDLQNERNSRMKYSLKRVISLKDLEFNLQGKNSRIFLEMSEEEGALWVSKIQQIGKTLNIESIESLYKKTKIKKKVKKEIRINHQTDYILLSKMGQYLNIKYGNSINQSLLFINKFENRNPENTILEEIIMNQLILFNQIIVLWKINKNYFQIIQWINQNC